MNSFAWIESLFKKAEKYIWMVHDQYILSTLPLYLSAVRRGMKVKLVEPRARAPERKLDSMRPIYLSDEDEETILNARLNGQVESRLLDAIDIFLYVTEKASMIAFPLSNETFDYLGFASEDLRARRYCQDLFQVYLEKSQKATTDELITRHETRKKLRETRTTK
jgi:predicted transcriptional regulator